MTGTDDRSPGSIEDLALSWGFSPERARRVAAIAAALAADSYPVDECLPEQRRASARVPVQRLGSSALHIDDDDAADKPSRAAE